MKRWKELLRKCAHHGLNLGTQVQTFYNGVNMGVRQLIDVFISGSINSKPPQEVFNFIEQIAMSNYTWGSTRSRAKLAGSHGIDMLTAMESRLAAMIEKKMGI